MRIAFACALMTLPLAAVADAVTPVDTVETHVNIRLEPAAGSDVVGRLQKGEFLPLLDSTDGWRRVPLEGGAHGFISAEWTRVVPDAATEPQPVPETEPVAEAKPAAEPEAAAEPEPAVEPEPAAESEPAPVPEPVAGAAAPLAGPPGPMGPPGPPGPPGGATIDGEPGYLVRFKDRHEGTSSQVYDTGTQVGIGTREPKQRLEVNGNIQIHERASSVAGLMITQSSGETGYVMHNRASTLTIGAGSVDRITIDRDGNVGLGVARPAHPLELANGAHVTAGGVWTDASSRELKKDIETLSAADALDAVAGLRPVRYRYRNEAGETYVGFIAEEVPELVASADRTGLSPMDVVAVLTRVVQAQQARIEALEARIGAAD